MRLKKLKYTFLTHMRINLKLVDLGGLVLAALILPVWFAERASNSSSQFAGFLFNPLDGNTYLAKMRLGWAGDWKFTNLFSPQSSEGAFLFLFYIALGHLGRWLNFNLIWMFHVARLLSSLYLLIAAWSFVKLCFPGDEKRAWFAYILITCGSGFGWLVSLATGYLTGDFWIAETYAFLSMFANPHFPLGLALILSILIAITRSEKKAVYKLLVYSFLLGIIQPFGVVVAAVALASHYIATFHKFMPQKLLVYGAALAPGGLALLYQYVAIKNDPLLALWNAQNITPAPPIWDLFVSLSPALLFAFVGAKSAWSENHETGRTTVIWLALGILLIYAPFSLQRRFMTGLFIPVAILSVYGIGWIAARLSRMQWLMPLVITFSILTNVLVILAAMSAVSQRDNRLFLSSAEVSAFRWIEQNIEKGSVVLASAETGGYIPGWTGMRVIYGHPFESVYADTALDNVDAFFSGQMDNSLQEDFLSTNQVKLILIGPRERKPGDGKFATQYPVAYKNDGVVIYMIP